MEFQELLGAALVAVGELTTPRKKTACSPGTLGELSTDSFGLKLFLGVAYFDKVSAHLQAKNAEGVPQWLWD